MASATQFFLLLVLGLVFAIINEGQADSVPIKRPHAHETKLTSLERERLKTYLKKLERSQSQPGEYGVEGHIPAHEKNTRNLVRQGIRNYFEKLERSQGEPGEDGVEGGIPEQKKKERILEPIGFQNSLAKLERKNAEKKEKERASAASESQIERERLRLYLKNFFRSHNADGNNGYDEKSTTEKPIIVKRTVYGNVSRSLENGALKVEIDLIEENSTECGLAENGKTCFGIYMIIKHNLKNDHTYTVTELSIGNINNCKELGDGGKTSESFKVHDSSKNKNKEKSLIWHKNFDQKILKGSCVTIKKYHSSHNEVTRTSHFLRLRKKTKRVMIKGKKH